MENKPKNQLNNESGNESENISQNESESRLLNPGQKPQKRKVTSKQAAALTGVILLAALYIGALIAAVADSSASGFWFRLCILGTIFIPILIWIYAWLYGRLTGRHTIASPAEMPGVSGQPDTTVQSGTSGKCGAP